MKAKFSKSWKASKQPRKQRKYVYNAPLHIKRKLIASTLSKELKKKYGMRSITLRKGDEVRVMRGKAKGKKGKMVEINKIKMKVAIENIQVTKKDGSKVNVWIDASNLMITNLNVDDARRLKRVKKVSEEKKPEVEKVIKGDGEKVIPKVNKEKKNAPKKK